MQFVHDVPGSRVVFGAGRRRELAAELDRLALTRPLLVTDPASKAGEELSDLLAPLLVGRFDEVVMHVPAEVAARAVDAARAAGADSVVVVGGGSAIGTAKAIAKDTHLPILAVPTTYAGSEMTPIWGITADRLKTTGRDPHVLPRVVIYDPELTVSLPPELTAASGMNALAHLAEGLYAPQVSPLAVLTAQDGIRALAVGLPKAVGRPDGPRRPRRGDLRRLARRLDARHHRDGHPPQDLPHPGRHLRPAACSVALRGHPVRAGRQRARRAGGDGRHRGGVPGSRARRRTTRRVRSGTCGTRSAPPSPCPRSASRPSRSTPPPTSSSGAGRSIRDRSTTPAPARFSPPRTSGDRPAGFLP